MIFLSRFSLLQSGEKDSKISKGSFEYLDGSDRINYHDLSSILKVAENMGESRNIELKYFNVSFYKKGTCHIEFTDEKLTEKIQHLRRQTEKLVAATLR